MGKKNEKVPLHNIETKQLRPLGFNIMALTGKGEKSYDSHVLHRHTFFELFFFKSGSGVHEIDFTQYPVEPHGVHFVSPGQIHRLQLKQAEGRVLCFTEEFVPLKPGESVAQSFPFFDISSPASARLSKQAGADIEALIEGINRDYHAGVPDPELFRHYLGIILVKLKLHLAEAGTESRHMAAGKNPKVVQFKDLINQHYLSHRPVSDYADELNISPNHLNALCKKHEGRTAIQLVHRRLLLESQRLLYATGLSVKEISFQLNFEDLPYFNRFFKKQLKLTPVQYRDSFQKER